MLKQMTGQRFGRLVVTAQLQSDASGNAAWACICDCGKHVSVSGAALRRGASSSCGCLKRELATDRATKHGMSKSGTYNSWASMLSRCRNPRHPQWLRYGGRGIRVCDRWMHFEHFLADMGHRPPGRTIDRKNGAGNYEPGNCRWATPTEQANNISTNRRIAVGDRTINLSQLARECGVNKHTLGWRLDAGWPLDKATNPQLENETC